jgi:DMSO/TMAO reductase YedYZ molybdopterin-dependent catalytic subunit
MTAIRKENKMAPIVSRGFRGRRAADVDPARVPPGQYVTQDFPVLSAGPTPHTSLELRDFSIVGELAEPRGWTWEEFRALPSEEITRDIHCVTKWSTLDTVWRGVSVDTLLEGVADHGSLDERLELDYAAAERAIAAAADAGIDADALAEHLQRHGAGAFTADWAALLTAIKEKAAKLTS